MIILSVIGIFLIFFIPTTIAIHRYNRRIDTGDFRPLLVPSVPNHDSKLEDILIYSASGERIDRGK